MALHNTLAIVLAIVVGTLITMCLRVVVNFYYFTKCRKLVFGKLNKISNWQTNALIKLYSTRMAPTPFDVITPWKPLPARQLYINTKRVIYRADEHEQF